MNNYNPSESEASYMNKKYQEWIHHGCQSPQDRDPSFIGCSFCHRRTPNLKLVTADGRDHLVCEKHSEYKED